MTVDLLAIAAHPDDAELTCGGTLVRCAEQGYRTGVLDLTRGEMASRGSPEIRAGEAGRAAEILGLSVRKNLGLPDARLTNDEASRSLLVKTLRKLRPRSVILPYLRGRHPDHRTASELARDACFLAGLKEYGEGDAHRAHKLLYALSYREDPVKPSFVVPVTEAQHTLKMKAIRCYESQFEGTDSAGEVFPTGQPLYELIETQDRHYGSLIRRPFGEPYYTEETMAIDDVVELPVRSI